MLDYLVHNGIEYRLEYDMHVESDRMYFIDGAMDGSPVALYSNFTYVKHLIRMQKIKKDMMLALQASTRRLLLISSNVTTISKLADEYFQQFGYSFSTTWMPMSNTIRVVIYKSIFGGLDHDVHKIEIDAYRFKDEVKDVIKIIIDFGNTIPSIRMQRVSDDMDRILAS